MDYLKYLLPRIATTKTASQTQTDPKPVLERKPDGYKNISTSSARPVEICIGSIPDEKSKSI